MYFKMIKSSYKSFLITFFSILIVFAMSPVMTGCKASRTAKGAAIGVGAGSVIGGVIGNQAGNTAAGAIIGAAVGGTAGALIGRHMDKQAEELQHDLKDATVERVGEGIMITFNSGLMFDVDSYNLRPQTKSNLDELGQVLNKYPDTNILVAGHTDSTGPNDYNMTLSDNRANSVERYLIQKGVEASRLSSVGYGETQPVASNDTASGRQKNRRVEVAIYANKKMQRMAKNGELGS